MSDVPTQGKRLTVLARVAAADLRNDVVLVLAGDDKDVLGAVAVDGGSQVEGEEVHPVLADAFVPLPDPHAAHPLLAIRDRESGVAKVQESFGRKISATDLDYDSVRKGGKRMPSSD